ncbi:MAG: hypothetical protein VB949_02100 [Pseudomonadales bacterium]
MTALADFHPGIRAGFESSFAEPTAVQTESWPQGPGALSFATP